MAKTDSEEMTSADIETLKADIQKLRDDLGELLGSVGSFSKEKLAETRDRLVSAVDDLQGKAYDRLHGTAARCGTAATGLSMSPEERWSKSP